MKVKLEEVGVLVDVFLELESALDDFCDFGRTLGRLLSILH